MDPAVYHPLPDIPLSDYPSFPGREYEDILLFRIVPVNPHIPASKSIHNLDGPSSLVSLKEGTARLSFSARRYGNWGHSYLCATAVPSQQVVVGRALI